MLVDGALIQDKTEIKNGSKIRIGEYTLYLEYKDQKEMNAGQDVLKTQIVSGNESGYKLVRVGDKFAGEEFMLTEASNSIGRTEDNYILLTEDSISRNHAKIVNVNLNYFVVDLGSSNGTFVNNKKIQGQVPLHGGDLIRFGSDVSFVFQRRNASIWRLMRMLDRSATIIACLLGFSWGCSSLSSLPLRSSSVCS